MLARQIPEVIAPTLERGEAYLELGMLSRFWGCGGTCRVAVFGPGLAVGIKWLSLLFPLP